MSKPFFHQGMRTHISAILGAAAPEEVICRYRAAESDGADSVALELRYLRPEFRNLETLRRIIHATSLPTMAIMYRNDCFKELVEDAPRQKLLLTAAEAGAAVIDVMGDLYSPAPDENTHDPAVIARQKELIGEIHARGALALMSSHPKRFMRADEVLAQRRAALSAALVRGDFDAVNAFSDDLALGLLPSAARSGRAPALREEIAALEAAGAGAYLLTAQSGAIYSSRTDGWEALSSARLRDLDPGLLEAVISAPVLAPSNAGRLVTGSAFLLSALTDSETAALFPPGDMFELRTKSGDFSGEVILLRCEGDSAAVVFRCRDAVEQVLNDRVISAEAVMRRTSGLLLPKEAPRRENNDIFVYRVAGKLLIRTAVTLLAETPEGLLVSSDA